MQELVAFASVDLSYAHRQQTPDANKVYCVSSTICFLDVCPKELQRLILQELDPRSLLNTCLTSQTLWKLGTNPEFIKSLFKFHGLCRIQLKPFDDAQPNKNVRYTLRFFGIRYNEKYLTEDCIHFHAARKVFDYYRTHNNLEGMKKVLLRYPRREFLEAFQNRSKKAPSKPERLHNPLKNFYKDAARVREFLTRHDFSHETQILAITYCSSQILLELGLEPELCIEHALDSDNAELYHKFAEKPTYKNFWQVLESRSVKKNSLQFFMAEKVPLFTEKEYEMIFDKIQRIPELVLKEYLRKPLPEKEYTLSRRTHEPPGKEKGHQPNPLPECVFEVLSSHSLYSCPFSTLRMIAKYQPFVYFRVPIEDFEDSVSIDLYLVRLLVEEFGVGIDPYYECDDYHVKKYLIEHYLNNF